MSKYIQIFDYDSSLLTCISVLVACDCATTYDNFTSKDVSSDDVRESGDMSYMDLESRIARGLLTPVYANGDLLLQDLDEYVVRLDKILDAFTVNKPRPRKFARTQMELIGKYGPKVYHLTWNKEHLMEVYNWDEIKLNKVFDTLNNIECLWDSVKTYIKW
uniref:Uncharacterized protein n=1 Tax=Graphocephala atropunctata TaxID=36148 RepID=A0A1B6L5D0_9HEMI